MYNKEWYEKNKEKKKAYGIEYKRKNRPRAKDLELRRKYNLTLEEYNNLLESQDNLCAICLKPETLIDHQTKKVRSLAVDHDHKTGKIRGLLCDSCNIGIGKLKDNSQTLRNAAEYLDKNIF